MGGSSSYSPVTRHSRVSGPATWNPLLHEYVTSDPGARES